MSIQERHLPNYLNWLMQNTLPGQVLLQSWLTRNGVDRKLSYLYVQNGWLRRIAHGVYCRTGREPDWVDAVYCLQTQWEKPVRVAGLTSLALQGHAHYTEPGKPQVWLALPAYVKLPGWFAAFEQSATFITLYTSGLTVDVSSFTTELKIGDRQLAGSAPELAAYEDRLRRSFVDLVRTCRCSVSGGIFSAHANCRHCFAPVIRLKPTG